MNDLKKRMSEVLAPHYVPTDSEQRVAERTAIAENVIADFEECVARQTFGAFLRGLCVDRGELVDAFYEARLSGALIEAKSEAPAETPAAPARRGGLLDLVKSSGARTPAPISAAPSTAVRARSNRNNGFARVALQLWSKSVHETCDDPAFADAIGVPRKALKEVATELIGTARRRGLEAKIKSAIADATHIETAEQAAAKATIVAERYVNRFVSSLGIEQPQRAIAFDASGIGELPADFQQNFVVMWLKSFYDEALANARSSDGLIHDAEQNARLGQILTAIEAGA
jgi:hypothetical protein